MMSRETQSEARAELWLNPPEGSDSHSGCQLSYRPAVLFECVVEFRDPRAEVIHTEDRFYTTWLPQPGAASDWSAPAVKDLQPEWLASEPRPDILPYGETVSVSPAQWDEMETDLLDFLVRTEKLTLYYSAGLKLYSKLGESREEFLHRISDSVWERLEPELKELARHFKMQLEQVRQAPLPETVTSERLQELDGIRRMAVSRLETRLTRIVLDDPRSFLLGEVETTHGLDDPPEEIQPLFEELARISADVEARLNALITETLEQAADCQPYTIGLQPSQIRIVRRALLWVPVPR
ncbi:MAG TPA: hypothetical protein VNM72_00405 [Blastocatellia bacterium]|nr:hypothetical protein [Blastocatellia bacterium]